MAAVAKKSPIRKTLSISTKPATPETAEQEPADIRDTLTEIEKAFASIGSQVFPTTQLPVAERRNNAQEAAEFVLADKLKKLAEARYKEAKDAASKAGIFGEEKDYKAGDTVLTWNSPHYAVSMKVGKPSQMIDRTQVEAVLIDRLGQEKGQAAMEECLKPREGAKQIIVSMK